MFPHPLVRVQVITYVTEPRAREGIHQPSRCSSLRGGVLTLTPPQCWTAVMGARLQRTCFTAASSLLEKTGCLGGPGSHVLPTGSSLWSSGLCQTGTALSKLNIGP